MRFVYVLLLVEVLFLNPAYSSWKKVYDYNWNVSFIESDISSLDSLRCILIGSSWSDGSICLKSEDGGTSWFVQYADTLKYLYDENGKKVGKENPKYSPMKYADYVTPTLLVAGHEDGSISVSRDGGNSFNLSANKIQGVVNGVQFADSLYGIVIGAFDVLRTTDGAYTWELLSGNLDTSKGGIQLTKLFLLNDNIYCAGYTNVQNKRISSFFKSTDKGETWKNYVNPTETDRFGIKSIFFIDAQEGWITDSYQKVINDSIYFSNLILHTTDCGETWTTQLDSITHYNKYGSTGVFFEDKQKGIAYGNSKAFWRTSDGGESWTLDTTLIDNSTDIFRKMVFPNGNLSRIVAPTVWKEIFLYDENLSSADQSALNFEVSPNPASDIISLTGFAPGERIEIYSQLGVKVLETRAGSEKIDVTALPAGVYFLKAGVRAGKFVKI